MENKIYKYNEIVMNILLFLINFENMLGNFGMGLWNNFENKIDHQNAQELNRRLLPSTPCCWLRP